MNRESEQYRFVRVEAYHTTLAHLEEQFRDTQVVAANHLIEEITPMVPRNRPAIGLVYAQATEHIDLIRKLQNPSIIAVVSVSESLLRTARSLLAPAHSPSLFCAAPPLA